MNSRERIMATLRGETVDRPAVNFYEVGGFSVDPNDPDPFNVYNDPSWRPLLQLAEEKSDLIRMAMLQPLPGGAQPRHEFYTHETYMQDGSRYTRTTLDAGRKTLTSLTRRDPGADTTWMLEHLLKDTDDLRAFLDLPDEAFEPDEVDIEAIRRMDRAVGDRGIILIDTADPIAEGGLLFEMGVYTIIANTEPELFHRLLERFAGPLLRRTETVAKACPGHLWRVVGPELATEPYLPPARFEEFIVPYTGPIVETIKRYDGYPRVHCHGRIKNALPHIHAMGADALDPIEPPPQGDVLLAAVRREYGKDMVLFGNIEIADIENMPPEKFRKVAEQSVRDGTSGEGRGFVLMPSSCPYGRTVSATTMANYETLIDVVQ